jgi:hypothetical protein
MATTTGLVQAITWAGNAVCFRIGSAPASAELLLVIFESTDSALRTGMKSGMVNLLVRARGARYPVSVVHGDSDSTITGATIPGFNICPARAVRGDFFTISGSQIPTDSVIDFASSAGTVTITPDVRRPDWLFVAQLPTSVATGRQTVRLRSPAASWTSDAVPIDVSAGPASFVRRLYTGAPKNAPYTIAFIANPTIRTNPGALVADPVTTNRPSFHTAVSFALDNMLNSTEDVLRGNNLDRQIQVVTVFDGTLAANDANGLVQEDSTNIISPRRDKTRSFLGGYQVITDVAFAMSGSTTHTRSSAWFTSDDMTRGTASFTYDGTTYNHGLYASIPGSVALATTAAGLTPFHEFGHASSIFDDGKVDDLYVDGLRAGLSINKKARALATNPIPTNFATYAGTTYPSDQNRDGIGYPATWTSYHPALQDTTRPNMMDNFWNATDPRRCRLDGLTHDWLTARLRAKANR